MILAEAAMGMSGVLIPPQEVSQRYDREHQEVSAQGVFFSATNFSPQITATPAIVGQFYKMVTDGQSSFQKIGLIKVMRPIAPQSRIMKPYQLPSGRSTIAP